MAKLTGLEAIDSQKKYLHILGIWPAKKETMSYKLRYYFTISMGLGFSSLPLFEMFSHIDDYGVFSEQLCLFISPLVFCLKVLSFKRQKSCFVELLQNMKQYPVQADETEMLETIKFSKRLVVAYTTWCTATGTAFVLKPLLGKQDLPVEFPYDLGRYKSVMYGFQALSAEISAVGLGFIDSLTINVISVGNAKLEILGNKIRNTGHLSKDLLAKKFSDIVAEHNGLIQYMQYVEKVFSYSFLAQFFNSIVALCNIVLQLTRADVKTEELTPMAMYLLAMLLQLALYCWFGNEVLIKSEKIVQACYECNWYEYDTEIRKYILIIMERSKIPLKLIAAKLATLSLQSFTKVIRSSYSVFTVMHRMYGKSREERLSATFFGVHKVFSRDLNDLCKGD